MDRAKFMDEEEVRSKLRPFCDMVSREIRPMPPDSADLLTSHMSGVMDFQQVRRDIASTTVAMSRAQRVGSSTRKEIAKLEKTLLALVSERQRILSRELNSPDFKIYRDEQKRDLKSKISEWQKAQDLAERAREILERPHIPRIIRPSKPSIRSLIEAVETHVEAAPPVGSLILMERRPRPTSPDFRPSSAYASGLDAKMFRISNGLNQRMFHGSARLAVDVDSDRGRQAEADGAIVSRDALVMRLGDNGRPLDEAQWKKFDDILPIAARQEMLPALPVCIPFSSPYSNLRRLLSVESWRAVRRSANDRSNGTCVMCGGISGGEVLAEWDFYEPPKKSGAFGIQKLLDVRSYCSACARVLYPEPGNMVALGPNPEGYKRSQEVYVVSQPMYRLSRLNRWDEYANPNPLATAVSIAQEDYQRRSWIRWALDLSVLHGINISLHPDMVMHRKGWIMQKSDVVLFDDDRGVHLTRIFGAAFINSDGTRNFFEVPQTHLVPWNTSIEDINGEVNEETSGDNAFLPGENHSDPGEDFEPAGPANPDEEDIIIEEGPPPSSVT